MRYRFIKLIRKEDETGISGTGEVANGIVLPSGKAVLWWNTQVTSVAIYDSLTNVIDLHGHNGKTDVVDITDPEELLELFGIESKTCLKKSYCKRHNGTETKRTV